MENCSSSSALISKRLEGKVAMITGGASGIGESTARLFTKEGSKVVIADIQDEIGQYVSKEIGCDYVHCDVTNESEVENAIKATIIKHGKLDIMFSNAGVTPENLSQSILEVDHKNYNKVFNVNVYGALLAAKHAASAMIPARKGSIIFTSSVASVSHGYVPHLYAVSKHALVGLTKNLCVELGQYGIRVNCISPYGVATPLLREAMGGMEKKVVEDILEAAANLKQVVMEANDVAEAALYLGSDYSKYVSGLNLVVDGGFSSTNVAFQETVNQFLPQ